MPQAGTDFPIHVLALPGARANQDNRNRRVANEIVPNLLPDGIGGKSAIVNIAISTDSSTILPSIIRTNHSL